MNNRTTKKRRHSGHEHTRTALSHEAIAQSFLDSLYFIQGRIKSQATKNDLYMSLAYAVRDRILSIWIKDLQDLEQFEQDLNIKFVSYLSAEFLPGPHLGNNLISLGIYEEARKALSGLGYDLEDLLGQEEEPGLGNGGLGRLASCFMDSLSTLHVPAIGYGIRYEFGIFDQEIRDGWQVEITDKWLGLGNPWEIAHPEMSQTVNLGGHTEHYYDGHGRYRVRWVPAGVIKGVPCDTPVLGYRSKICNTLREEVGAENFFLFGMTTEEVYDLKTRGYSPREYYESNAKLREVIDQISLGYFSRGDKNLFKPLVDSLLDRDDYMLLADYQSYIDGQERVGEAFLDSKKWTHMSILNAARMGKFSSDRSIKEYCEKIWDAKQIMYED